MILVNDGLCRSPLLEGLIGNRGSMFITATYKQNIMAARSVVTGEDISRYVSASQMPDVFGSVGVRQCRSDGDAFI